MIHEAARSENKDPPTFLVCTAVERSLRSKYRSAFLRSRLTVKRYLVARRSETPSARRRTGTQRRAAQSPLVSRRSRQHRRPDPESSESLSIWYNLVQYWSLPFASARPRKGQVTRPTVIQRWRVTETAVIARVDARALAGWLAGWLMGSWVHVVLSERCKFYDRERRDGNRRFLRSVPIKISLMNSVLVSLGLRGPSASSPAPQVYGSSTRPVLV